MGISYNTKFIFFYLDFSFCLIDANIYANDTKRYNMYMYFWHFHTVFVKDANQYGSL